MASAQLFTYNESDFTEIKKFDVNGMPEFTESCVNWLNIYKLNAPEMLQTVFNKLDIHRLVREDVFDEASRPGFHEYENHSFFFVKSILPGKADNELLVESISFIFDRNYVVSIQEKKGDHFNWIRERIRENTGIVRSKKADYLLYLLLKAILDNYMTTILKIRDEISVMLYKNHDLDADAYFGIIEKHNRLLFMMKRYLFPIRDAIGSLEKGTAGFVTPRTKHYYQDIKEQCSLIIEEIDSLHNELSGRENLFLALQGHKLNEVMKTLTIVATIFIPLTFIAGVYGMNFNYMPETQYKYGYFVVLGIMLVMAIWMLILFKRKKWF